MCTEKCCSWTESSLKSFLDHHGVPTPEPRTRDTLLTSARQNYDAIAKKTSEYSAYPGNWLYSTWSESDLKEFLDARGYPVPQPSTRDRLVATVRRNARLASLNMQSGASSVSASYSSGASAASKSAANAQESLSDALFDAWSDSKIKEFLDSHGVPVPQGSKKNELIALARKHRASLAGNEASSVSGSAASAFGAATSKAGNQYAKATDDASMASEDAFNTALDAWSESRLKAFLDSRGVPVPQGSKKNELVKQARLHKHKAATGWSAWTFDTWTVDNLQKYLQSNGKKYKKNAKASRDDLVKQAQDNYASASKSGGSQYATITNYLAKQTDAAKDTTFDDWSESDVKKYLDSYGVSTYQGSTLNELRAEARKQYNYFKYGTSTPSDTIFERIKSGFQWAFGQLQGGAASGSAEFSRSATSAASAASRSATSAKAEL
jgi:Putative nuclear envelope organisation protein